MSIIHSSPGDLHPAAAHPETGPPAPLTRGFAPCSRTSAPAWRRALQKGYKKAARASSAASLYPFAVRGGFEPPVR